MEKIMRRIGLIGVGAGIVLLASALGGWAADRGSQKFITEAIQGNLAEIEVGKLAQEKGQSEGVRSFGSHLVQDHTAANQKATSLASSMGVTPPTEPTSKQKTLHARLSKLSGESFDREFAKAMVNDHKNDIREFEKEAKRKNDPAADFANETLPTLRKHLEMAQALTARR
jgi:putative membrane protein